MKCTKPDMRLLLNHRADPTVEDRDGTPLDVAGGRGRYEVVFFWDFNNFAKLAILKMVGAGEGSLPVVRTALTRQVITSIPGVSHG